MRASHDPYEAYIRSGRLFGNQRFRRSERMAQLPRRLDDCHAHASVILVIGGALAHGLLLSQALENGVQMLQKGGKKKRLGALTTHAQRNAFSGVLAH